MKLDYDDHHAELDDLEIEKTCQKLARLAVLVERHPFYKFERGPLNHADRSAWLMAAADAERTWRSWDRMYLVEHDPLGRGTDFPYVPDFMKAAYDFAAPRSSFIIRLDSWLGNNCENQLHISSFTLLANAGFFQLGEDRIYRYAVPKPTPESVKAAFLE